MKLSNKTLTRLVKGAVYFENEKGYLCMHRFSKAQTEYMADPSYDYGWRNWAKFTGGIRLEFKTNSQSISFDYLSSCQHERGNTVDLYIDNVLHSIYKIEDKLRGSVHFFLPNGEKTVTIYFPGESIFKIKNFTIDGNYKTTKDKRHKLLVIGDSITQGAGPEFSSASYINTLNREYHFNILDQGIAGYRYEPQDLMKVDGFEPDKIMVFLGTNWYEVDCLEKGYDYERGVKGFYKKLTQLYPNTPILSITPLWRNNNVNWDRFMWCINTIKDTCKLYKNIEILDGFTLVPNVDECFSDKVHPNAYGSLYLANRLMSHMKKIKF